MATFDHLGISVESVPTASAQFHPVLEALGYVRSHDAEDLAYWRRDDEPEILLYPARENAVGPHEHGRVGWQHLAYAVDSREEVDRLHDIALAAGWVEVRGPKEYPRFSKRYYAAFVEDANGIRFEFMHNPRDED